MTMRRTIAVAAALGILSAACGTSDDMASPGPTSLATTALSIPNVPSTASTGDSSQPSVSTVATTAPTVRGNPVTTALTTTSTTADPEAAVDGQTIIRFTAGDTHLDVTIRDDNATIRDFLSMLPLTLRFEEFNGREKISYLPRPLDTTATAGSNPEDGDLIYYAPWGNLGFYYNTAGIGFSDDVIHLGTYNASPDELTALERGDVTVDIVQ